MNGISAEDPYLCEDTIS